MSTRRPPARRWFSLCCPILCAAGVITALGGCLVYDVASAPVKVAATTVVVAGETSATVVKTTGRVAMSAVRATGNLTSDGLDATSRLAQTGMVTFTDAATLTTKRVPWRSGMTLAAAARAAKVNLAERAVTVVRAGAARQTLATEKDAERWVLRGGDVVSLAPVATAAELR